MSHTCHWPRGCPVDVPPRMMMCKAHWFKVPKALRDRIWSAYRPGQEIDKQPDAKYMEAVRAVDQWVCEHYPPPPATPTQGQLL